MHDFHAIGTKILFGMALIALPLSALAFDPSLGQLTTDTTQSQPTGTVAFTNVTVIPMDSERVLENHTVIVEGDRIAAVGPSDEITVPEGAVVVDGTGMYLMPGLADMHYHANTRPQALTLAIAYGVTTIRNFNVFPEEIETARRIEAGELLGPTHYNGWSIGAAPRGFLQARLFQLGAGLVFGVLLFLLALAVQRLTGRPRLPQSLRSRVLVGIGVAVSVSLIGTFTNLISQEPIYQLLAPDRATRSPRGAERIVRKYSDAGIDFIKTNQLLPREVFDAIAATSEKEGLPFTGHVSGEVGIEYFLNSGGEIQHTTEIAPFLSDAGVYDKPLQEFDLLLADERMPMVVDLYARNGKSFTPTLDLMNHVSLHLDDESFAAHYARSEVRLMPPGEWQGMDNPDNNFVVQLFGGKEAYVEKYRAFENRLVKELFEAGVPILAGTDVTSAPGMIYGDSLLVELELLVGAGLTPYQALDAATRTPAEAMGDLDEWGTVEIGKRADIVLLAANPLEDITNTRQIEGVMVRGRWLPQIELQQMLAEIPASYETE